MVSIPRNTFLLSNDKTESARAPSYFSQFFVQQIANLEEGQNLRTLYIDRDPITFRDIARHLQGALLPGVCNYEKRPRVLIAAQVTMFLPKMDSILFGYSQMRNSTAVSYYAAHFPCFN